MELVLSAGVACETHRRSLGSAVWFRSNFPARLSRFCVSFIVMSLMLTVISDAEIALKNAVGIWLFDEGSGEIAKDFSGNGNDGKLIKGPKWVVGKFGNALSFDGNGSYVDAGVDASLSFPSNSFTLSAWIKTPKSESVSYNGLIIDTKYDGRPDKSGYDFYLFRHGVVIRVGNGSSLAVSGVADKGKEIYDHNWHHVVGVVDRTEKQIKTYVDGKKNEEKELSLEGDFSNSYSLKIGKHQSADSRFFEGLIDEVVIFNKALTKDDINNIMTKGLDEALNIRAVSPAGKLATAWGVIKNQY